MLGVLGTYLLLGDLATMGLTSGTVVRDLAVVRERIWERKGSFSFLLKIYIFCKSKRTYISILLDKR
jgi:hypothetical protein